MTRGGRLSTGHQRRRRRPVPLKTLPRRAKQENRHIPLAPLTFLSATAAVDVSPRATTPVESFNRQTMLPDGARMPLHCGLPALPFNYAVHIYLAVSEVVDGVPCT